MYEWSDLQALLLAFLQNIALFIVLSFMLGRLADRFEAPRGLTWNVVATLIFSFGAIVSMAMPFEPVEGVLLDQRNMILLFAGSFGGPWVAILSGAITAVARLMVGGFGAEAGAGAAISSALLGIFAARYMGGLQRTRMALLAGVMLGLVNWPWALVFPVPSVGADLSARFALPFLFLYLAGAATLSAILMVHRRRLLQERELARARQRLEDIIDVSTDWFWETDSEHRMTYVSPSHERIFASPPEDVLGHRRSDLAAPDQKHLLVEMEARMDRQERIEGFRYAFRNEQGVRRHVSISGKPMRDAKGVVLGYRGSGRDVEKEVSAEAGLREALSRAETANQAKSEFLSNMSHELRTPLNAIIGFAEMMQMEMRGRLGADGYREDARNIVDAGRHLLSLINDLLHLSRMEAGKSEPEREETDINLIVGEAAAMLTPTARQQGITLQVEGGIDGRVVIDPRAIKQVLLNLISNAVKFTPENGTVSIGLSPLDATGIHLTVRDTGIGIPPHEIEKVLQPFERAESVRRQAIEGTGLGLPISRALVEAHGGELTIESVEGKGTCVAVRLPDCRAETPISAIARSA